MSGWNIKYSSSCTLHFVNIAYHIDVRNLGPLTENGLRGTALKSQGRQSVYQPEGVRIAFPLLVTVGICNIIFDKQKFPFPKTSTPHHSNRM